jgi:hypothetical protein
LESFEKLLFQITLNKSNYSCVSIPEKTGEIREDLKNKRSRVHCVLASWADIKKEQFFMNQIDKKYRTISKA